MLDTVLNLVVSWPVMISRAFTQHSLAAAVLTVAAIGIFVVLQQELRPYGLLTNIAYVASGYVISISLLVPLMAGMRKAWAMLETALPFAGKLSAYLYGICERHPMVALAIVGVGTTTYFLKQPWPTLVSWGPVRAVCAVFGIALMIHIAGPIADLVTGEEQANVVQGEETFAQVAAADAFARAIKSGDVRYVSVRQCVDEVPGYPTSEPGKPELPSPWTIGVRQLGASCYENLGHEGDRRMRRHQEYAAEYNRLMYEHNRNSRLHEQVEHPERPVPLRVGGIL
jgi:hypothetical protein